MRKAAFHLLTCFLALVLSLPGFAQEKNITGKITGSDSKPLEGATVRVKGSNRTSLTNAEGVFTIKANKGDVLLISHVGFEEFTAKVGDGAFIAVKLTATDKALGEVVVTAMDIKRNPRELGYSTQTVKGTDIKETQRENFITALQGRVAGVTITPTSGAAGSSAAIVLRGFNTLSGNNQPLFVIDGIIVDNQTFNENSQGQTGVGLASDLPNRNNDYTNRIADLNPNDIESVTVLKGPEATALYGSQASSGAIIITSKKAKSTNGKVLVSYDDNFRMQRINRFAAVDNSYGPGTNGVPTAPPLSGQFTSFGPAWPADTKFYDNLHHFFNTGFTQTHSIGMEFGTKNVGFRLSGQYLDDHGVVPFNSYTKYNFKLANNTKIGKYITLSPSIQYIHADNLKPLKGASGYLLDLYSWPVNNDIRNYQDPKGNKVPLFTTLNGDYDNPIWSAKNNKTGDLTDRIVATMGIDITPYSWLTLSGRFGFDTYKTDGYLFYHPESYLLGASTGGELDNYYRRYDGYNHTITATLHKDFGKFTTRLIVGTMWEDLETKEFGLYGTHLKDSSSTDSSNTLASSRVRLLRNTVGLPNLSIIREMAYFGEASIGYNNVVFLTYSHRFESASPLPAQNRNYNYPGASLSVIMSDIFPFIKTGNVINFWKMRGSLASTARLNDPYTNQSVFVNDQASSAIAGYAYGYTNANPDLRPERQHTYEIGTEMRLLNNAISLEAAYYNTLCLDQISQGYRASYATGFILNTGNVSSLRNQGFELTLDVNPIKKADFNWDITFNFNHMWSKVLTLPAAIGQFNDYYNSDTYITNARGGLVRGHSTGTITGSSYQRNNAGKVLVDPSTGRALINATWVVIGDRTPAFTLGTLNTFRYKNFNLSFLWDLKIGGDVYNGTDQFLTGLGKSVRTSNRKVPIVVNGVLADGLQNTASPTKNNIVIVPYYLNTYYTGLPDEEFIQHNVNWLRLRDVTFSYRLPASTIRRMKPLQGASVFVTLNDIVLITNYQGADPAVNANNPGTAGVGSYAFDYGSPPTPISVSGGIRVNF
ncbi:MAG TPA: SusC/RagA family TonB-linked outer membrane protein [Chitinophagaceae bacterium]